MDFKYGGRTCKSNMKKAKKFVYNTVCSGSNKTPRVGNDNCSATSTTGEIKNPGFSQDGMEFCDFDFDDDITSQMTDADLDRLEIEATRKLGLLNNDPGLKNVQSINDMKCVKDVNAATFTNQCGTTQRAMETRAIPYLRTPVVKQEIDSKDSQLQLLAIQLQEYKSKVKELENSIYIKNGELKLLQNSLNEHREENAKKSAKIVQLTNEQNAEKSERESNLTKELETLKTRLSFQEQELKEQSNRLISQKVSGSVKRKADIPTTSSVFDLENSFLCSQISCSKVPRLERKSERGRSEKKVKKELNFSEMRSTCQTATSKIDKPGEISTLHACNAHLESTVQTLCESKACYLVKKLVFSHTRDSVSDVSQDETTSLLTLLKYPLKHLSDVLKSHCVDTNHDQSLSQFLIWQTQMHGGSGTDYFSSEELDLDEGKYNLVSQGIFVLLGLSNQLDMNVDNLGVIHILVFLELYISSYCLARERAKYNNKSDVRNISSDPATHEAEQRRASHNEQDMILQTLQILKLLFYSAPDLVKCVLDRTSPAVFIEDVIIIHDSDENTTTNKNAAVPTSGVACIPGCSENCFTQGDENVVKGEIRQVFEGAAMCSFRSLLLPNLQKLLVPHSDGSLSICHAALEVLIAITTFCTNMELERIFVPLKSGCLTELIAKDSGMLTVSRIISLISCLLPCRELHTILCSQTDECILLKIYQCVCDEEDDEESDEARKDFLLQFVKFLKDVALSHNDSVEFLLETDCQCSLEIIRCLVLVLYEKVNYLLDLSIETMILDESVSILRTGINILVILCTHSSYTADHKLDVESHYGDLIYKSMMLFKHIKHHIPELEALGLQDLLDMEQIDEIEWSLGSDDEEDDECMVINS